MKAATFEWLCGLLELLLDCRDPVGPLLDLPAETRLGIGLFRLTTGSDHCEISARLGVSEAVSKFCVKQICCVLCTNYRFWVGFPGHAELKSQRNANLFLVSVCPWVEEEEEEEGVDAGVRVKKSTEF